MTVDTSNIRIQQITPLRSPEDIVKEIPLNQEMAEHVARSRIAIENIIQGKDKRLLVMVGPCSIHDRDGALEYAQRLKKLSDRYQDKLMIVMRVYFEKPRTTTGWKGLINDPYLDDSFVINDGLVLAREILRDINQMGLPVATEFVDTITPQYIADWVSWAAIGARTTESQPHRMLASGLSMPVGFKNNTAGDVTVAVNAVVAASSGHRFLSVTETGEGAIVVTEGNPFCHVVLRGGVSGVNYKSQDVQSAVDLLKQKNLAPRVVVDCSHDNCFKDYRQQTSVIRDIASQLKESSGQGIMGVMVESNLVAGKQALGSGKDLVYGQSITDGCIGWDETEAMLDELASSCAKEALCPH